MSADKGREWDSFPYYKLERWSDRSLCFENGKRAFGSRDEALAAFAKVPRGKYRITEVTEAGRRELEELSK